MQEWLHDILAADLSPPDSSPKMAAPSLNWQEGEVEMQRLIDLLPAEGQLAGIELTEPSIPWGIGVF